MEESASLGKEARRPSIRERGMGRKCRERTALPPRVQIEAARTTCKGEGELMKQGRGDVGFGRAYHVEQRLLVFDLI